jgi:hypothetical protein
MRRDRLINILILVASLAFAASFMVGMDYRHLSGVALATFVGGIVIGVFLAMTIIALAIEDRRAEAKAGGMTVDDIGLNAALVAGVATLVAAFFRARRAAIIACVVAWVGIGVDYWWGPPRGLSWSSPTVTSVSGFKGEPIGWSPPLLGSFTEQATKALSITGISIVGNNVSKQEVKLDDAYFLSGIDGTRLDAKITWGGSTYKVQEIRPVPAGAILIMSASFGKLGVGLSQDDFMQKWAVMIFVTVQNGVSQRIDFDREKMKSFLPKPPQPIPHVSTIKQE